MPNNTPLNLSSFSFNLTARWEMLLVLLQLDKHTTGAVWTTQLNTWLSTEFLVLFRIESKHGMNTLGTLKACWVRLTCSFDYWFHKMSCCASDDSMFLSYSQFSLSANSLSVNSCIYEGQNCWLSLIIHTPLICYAEIFRIVPETSSDPFKMVGRSFHQPF